MATTQGPALTGGLLLLRTLRNNFSLMQATVAATRESPLRSSTEMETTQEWQLPIAMKMH